MREITIIAGLQIVFVVLGWCALGIVLKFNGYPNDNPFVRWTPLAVWLREHGIWLLLVSPVWSGIAVTICSRMEDHDVLNTFTTAIGVAFGLAIFACFLTATFAPYTRPLLIKL